MMKHLLIGLVMATAMLSANASDINSGGISHQPRSTWVPPKQPLCQPGQTLVPIYDSTGRIVEWVCE